MADVSNKKISIYIDQGAAELALANLQARAERLNKAIADGQNGAKDMTSEIKKLGDTQSSMAALQEKADKLTILIDAGKNAGRDMTKEIEKLAKTQYAWIVLKEKAEKLTKAIEAGQHATKDMSAEIKKLAETQAAIQKVEAQISGGLRPSMAQVEAQVTKLRNELRLMSEDAPEYAAKFESFKTASLELNKLRESMSSVQKAEKSWFNEAKAVAFGVVIGNTVQGVIESLTGYVTGMIDGNAKLSDSLSDIEKSANLSASAVAELNSRLKSIDTRTSSADLREMAVGLGQVGVEANKINIQAMDKIVVSLGDEFAGGAKEITESLSVLRNNLEDLKSGNYADDVTHIGNALNVLGSEGLASAPVVTDIANRIAGISGTFKVTSGEILGLAATFQELGIESERGSTAITKMFQKIGAEPEKFAKVAGGAFAEGAKGIKAFKELINTDMLSAFNAVAAGAKKAGGSNIVFSQVLKELDADGSGAGEVISKLGAQHEMLANKVVTATNALKNDSSITEEFNKKNNNLAANLEKLSKNISGWFANSTLSNFFNGMISGMVQLTKHTQTATEKFDDQVASLVGLKTNIEPLLPRYDELKNKTKLTVPEQAEMKKIIEQVTNVMPGAITAFDKYGNAIGISTDRVKEFIGAEKARLKVTNADAIEENAKALDRIKKQLEAKKKDIEQIAKTGTFTVFEESLSYGMGMGGGVPHTRKANQKEIAEAELKYKELIEKRTGYEAEIERLNGDALQKQLDAKAKAEAEAKKRQEDFKKTDPNAKSPFGETKSAEQKERDSLLEKLKNFQFELQQVGKDHDESEVERIKKKYNELMKEATQHGVALINLEKDKNRAIAYLIEKDALERKAAQEKLFKEQAEADYQNQLKTSAEFFELKKQEQSKLYSDGIIDRTQYEINLNAIDVEARRQDIATAQDYAANSKKAAEDVLVFKKKLTAEEIQDAIKKREQLVENEKLLAELKAKAAITSLENKVNNAQPGSAARFNAEKNLRDEQKRQELAAIEKQETDYRLRGIAFTDEFETLKQSIRDKYRQADAKAEIDFYANKINNVLGYVSNALNIVDQFNKARDNREKEALDRELKGNEAKRKGIDSLLKNKVISEIEAKRRLKEIDNDDERKKDELEKKQAARNKKIAIAQAIVNGALAVTSILAQYPKFDFGIAAAIAIGAAVATTAAQVAVISSTKYAKGGKLTGHSHSEGGMPVINRKTGKIEAEMEGGEYILSRSTVANNRRLADLLLHSSMNEGGRQISLPEWQTRQYVPINYEGITANIQKVRFAEGGIFNAGNNTVAASPGTGAAGVDNTILLEAILNNLKNPTPPVVRTSVSLKQIDDAYADQTTILQEAGG